LILFILLCCDAGSSKQQRTHYSNINPVLHELFPAVRKKIETCTDDLKHV